MFPIPVLDTIVLSLSGDRVDEWKAARKTALDKWRVLPGLTLVVEAADPDSYPKLDASRLAEPQYVDTLIVPAYLRLMRLTPGEYKPAFAWWTWPPAPNGAATFYNLDYFWRQTKGYQAYMIGHEIGHCLGLSNFA